MPALVDRPASPRIAALGLIFALLGAASMLYYHLGLFIPRVLEVRAARGLGNGYSFGDDFYPIWLTTRLARQGDQNLYSPGVTRQIQTGLFGRPLNANNPTDPPTDYRSFAYPAFADLLLWPLALFDFPALRLLLAVLLPILTAVSLWLWMFAIRWPARPVTFAIFLVLALCNYPLLEAFFAEQPGLIVGFLLACAAAALRRDQLLAAGALMAATLIKPQMTLLAVGYLLLWSLSVKTRSRFWIGFSAMLALMLGASLWLWPHWIQQWIGILRGYPRYATPSLVGLLPGSFLGRYVGPVAIAVLLAVAAFLAWRGRRANCNSPEFWLTFTLVLAITSVTLLPGQAIYDHIILYPGILLLVRKWRDFLRIGGTPRALFAIGAVVLFWPWVAAFVLIAVRPFLSAGTFASNTVFALPIRTAASLPFAVLALLGCVVRFNALRPEESV